MEEITVPITQEESVLLLGPGEQNLRTIEQLMNITVNSRGGDLRIQSSKKKDAELAVRLFRQLLKRTKDGKILSKDDVSYHARSLIDRENPGSANGFAAEVSQPVVITGRKETIRPKTKGQQNFCSAVQRNDVTFAIGPAGTGKTFLAVAMAVQALQTGAVDRIILARPAIEAGESLGFLPGDMKEKVDPYLRPIHDALFDLLPPSRLQSYVKQSVIETAPIAYMRGRTLNNAYAILDEAQNCTTGQMKMFLTRLGFNSKAIITGDVTQIDLKKGTDSGLVTIQRILKDVAGISFCYFSSEDVVRHRLVKKIVDAYQQHEISEN